MFVGRRWGGNGKKDEEQMNGERGGDEVMVSDGKWEEERRM